MSGNNSKNIAHMNQQKNKASFNSTNSTAGGAGQTGGAISISNGGVPSGTGSHGSGSFKYKQPSNNQHILMRDST